MKNIKTRETKKDIKALDKSRVLAERMKNAATQTKEKAEQGISANENSPNEYATDRTEQTAGHIKDKAIYEFNKQGQKGLEETKQNISKARDFIRNRRNNGGSYSETNNGSGTKSTKNPVSKQIKTFDRGEKTIKQSSRSAGKATVKTSEKQTIKTTQKSVKTAEKSSKTAVKTAQQSAKAAQKTVQATVKASQRAAQATQRTARAAAQAAKAAATTLKAALKATIASVKAIIAGTKALVAAIAAGGWIAIVVIVIICLIALIFGSCFGIFFSGEDSGTGQTIQTAVQEINAEYQTKLNETKASYTYDVLEMSGSRAVWKEVLAVYAVKATTDSDNPKEVATVDDGKKEKLKSIFWDMNEISSRTQTKTETVIDTADDGHGNIVETEKIVTRTYLYITISHKTAKQMADKYGFNTDQRKQLSELLSDENNSMWSTVLYGISGSDGQLVTIALSQVGNTGGQPYWSWYGFSSRVEWCACFVSWCANECG